MSASGVDSVEKVFGGDDRILRGPLMRFVRGDVSDHTFLRKRTIEVRIDATEYCRGGVGRNFRSGSICNIIGVKSRHP